MHTGCPDVHTICPSSHSLSAHAMPAVHWLQVPLPLHTPMPLLHEVPADRYAVWVHTGSPEPHAICPRSQSDTAHVVQAAHGVHMPEPSHTPGPELLVHVEPIG